MADDPARRGEPPAIPPAPGAGEAAARAGIASLRLTPDAGTRAGGLLFVLAHPDDETFLCGGTIARYAAAGHAVDLACATRGEGGSLAPARGDARPIAEVRTAELIAAARALGLAAIHFLGYRDSGVAGPAAARHPRALVNTPPAAVGEQIATLIRALRPRVVVTHGPFGEYGHPDHRHLHEATLRACRAAGDPRASGDLPPWSPEALYAIAFRPRFLGTMVRLLRLAGRDPRHFGQNGDVDLVTLAANLPSATCAIDTGPWLASRDRAFACHRSQLREQRLRLLPPRALRRRFLATESYARLLPPPRPDEPLRHDLFGE